MSNIAEIVSGSTCIRLIDSRGYRKGQMFYANGNRVTLSQRNMACLPNPGQNHVRHISCADKFNSNNIGKNFFIIIYHIIYNTSRSYFILQIY